MFSSMMIATTGTVTDTLAFDWGLMGYRAILAGKGQTARPYLPRSAQPEAAVRSVRELFS
jgi:hypothetical protein